MKFIVDSMLGSLAKWLRILGYDTLYFSDLDDDNLARLARSEQRVLLTRDQGLAHRKGLKALLIKSEKLEEQIGQVLRELNLTEQNPFSRCPVCNTPLQAVDKEQVRDRVPPYVFQTQERFSICPGCQRVYWRGSHWQKMNEKIPALLASRENTDDG